MFGIKQMGKRTKLRKNHFAKKSRFKKCATRTLYLKKAYALFIKKFQFEKYLYFHHNLSIKTDLTSVFSRKKFNQLSGLILKNKKSKNFLIVYGIGHFKSEMVKSSHSKNCLVKLETLNF